ncbi:MOSC domain-containing protein [uncultured Hoeflea sp.]|uniref:MOSC domain-containing protein n=1 Tax=uncultured Hoeflea sp. TaxID=538666 RepID=UPI00261B032E|nr:MOSC domain-containing protein [uncultured Hoeflea sp.]
MTILNPSKITGVVKALLANGEVEDDSLKTKPIEKATMTFGGMQEDRHSKLVTKADVRYRRQYPDGTPIRNTRQVSILSVEELLVIQHKMDLPEFDAGWIGANMVVSGIPDFTLLPPSTRLLFSSGAALVVDNENRPCRYPGDEIEALYPGHGRFFAKAAANRRGVVAWVEKEGDINLDDQIAVHLPPLRLYPHG